MEDTLQSVHLPWTPGGIALLNKINDIILKNGGLEAMHAIVDLEVNENHYSKIVRKERELLDKCIKYKMSVGDGSALLSLNRVNYVRKLTAYRLTLKENST
jgi:hypothetical protein